MKRVLSVVAAVVLVAGMFALSVSAETRTLTDPVSGISVGWYSDDTTMLGVQLHATKLMPGDYGKFQVDKGTILAAYDIWFTDMEGGVVHPNISTYIRFPDDTIKRNAKYNIIYLWEPGQQTVDNRWAWTDEDGEVQLSNFHLLTPSVALVELPTKAVNEQEQKEISKILSRLNYWSYAGSLLQSEADPHYGSWSAIFSVEELLRLFSVASERKSEQDGENTRYYTEYYYESEVVDAYRNDKLNQLVAISEAKIKTILANDFDEQKMAKAQRYVNARLSFDLAKDAYEKFPRPFPIPEQPLTEEQRNTLPQRILSRRASDLLRELWNNTNNWYQGASEFAQRTLNDHIVLYEQAAQKWTDALQRVKDAGFVDTTEAERAEAARRVHAVAGLFREDLIQHSDWKPGNSANLQYMNLGDGSITQIAGMSLTIKGLEDLGEYERITTMRSGELDQALAIAKSGLYRIMQEYLTEEAFRGFQKYCDYYAKAVAYENAAKDPNSAVSRLEAQLKNLDINTLPESQMLALWQFETDAELRAFLNYLWSTGYSYQRVADYEHFLLWMQWEQGRILGIDLTPIIGVISKPTVPATGPINIPSTLTLTRKQACDTFTKVDTDKITWQSSKPGVLKINDKGEITYPFAKTGATVITAWADGKEIARTEVTVKWEPWQWFLVVVLFGWLYL